jgi:hypothetical protein
MKYVVVTGAFGGMGKSVCEHLAKDGYTVFALDKRVKEAEENVVPIEADVTDVQSLKNALKTVETVTDELFAVLHFAGVYMLDSLVEMDEEEFDRIFKINLYGVFYINKNLVSPIGNNKSESELRKSVSETAKAFLGVQYRWGGRTMAGIDCSGLCFNAYRFNGINIWRDADITLSPNIRKIDHKNAKTGDLMFFKGHIAMYLGNNEIIHSTASKGKVVIEHFDENSPLYNIFICVGTAF